MAGAPCGRAAFRSVERAMSWVGDLSLNGTNKTMDVILILRPRTLPGRLENGVPYLRHDLDYL
jgi:hypothetical protein